MDVIRLVVRIVIEPAIFLVEMYKIVKISDGFNLKLLRMEMIESNSLQ